MLSIRQTLKGLTMANKASTESLRQSHTKQEARSALTRQKLLEAAVHIIQTEGIAALNVRAICEQAGLSTGAFYHLFNSKEDVINYYLNSTFERYKEEALNSTANLSAAQKVRNIYQYTIKCYMEAGYEFMTAFYSPSNAMLNFRMRPNDEPVVLEEVYSYLEQGQRDGSILPDVDLEEAKLEIAMIVTGAMFYWCVFKGDMDAASIVDKNLENYLSTLETSKNLSADL